MVLSKQPIALQFQGGLDSKTDSKQVPTAKLLVLENATFIKETTLSKRNGYRALSQAKDDATGNYTDPVGLGSRGSELLLFDGERAWSHRSSTDTWADSGEVASVIATAKPIARTGTAQTMVDHATNGGVTVVAWEDSRGGVWCSVVEGTDGNILLADYQLDANGRIPRCVAVGDVLHVYWWESGSTYLHVAVINPLTPSSTPASSILTTDFDSAHPYYDACDAGPVYTSLKPAVMAWSIAGGYRVGYVHPSGVLGSPVTSLPTVATYTDAAAGPIGVAVDRITGTYVGVIYTSGGTASARWVTATDLTSSPGTAIVLAVGSSFVRVACEIAAGSLLWWVGEVTGATDDVHSVRGGSVTTALAVSPSLSVLGHGVLSRAFLDNGHVYVVVGHGVNYFPYAAVCRISGDVFDTTGTQCFARLVPSELPGLPVRGHVASVQPVSPDSSGLSRQHRVTLGYRIQLAVDAKSNAVSDNFSEEGAKLATLDFDAATSYQSIKLGANLYLASACLQSYDGKRWTEADFHTAPDTASGGITGARSGSGSIAVGTYNYVACYESIDAQGELHRGPVSAPLTVTITSENGVSKVGLTIPTYRLTNKSHVRIGVFRSPVDQTGEPDAIPYYRVTDTDPTATGDNGYLLNDPTTDAVAFTDNLTDTVLIAREPLYTNGGISSNDPAPITGAVIAGSKSRLYAVDQADPSLVRYSQELAEDTAIEWPIGNTLPVDPYGGDIVGVGILDDAVIVFKETATYVFGGPGPLADPTADPANHSFSVPELLTSDVGCKAPASICQTPAGIVFQSSKGIMLVDRSRQVQDIGRDVWAYNSQTITRASLLPDRPQVVFLTDSGSTLMWDYRRNQWSVYTNHLGYDAVVVGGTYHYLRTDGRVFAETPGVYADDNQHIRMAIETAWVKLAGYLQGWQRILWAYFIGTYVSAHTLRVRYRLDYNTGYSAPIDLDVDSNQNPENYGDGNYGDGAYGGSGGDTSRYQRRIHLNKRCQAISFRIEDVEATAAFGASFELSELLLIGGVLGPAFKPGAARTN